MTARVVGVGAWDGRNLFAPRRTLKVVAPDGWLAVGDHPADGPLSGTRIQLLPKRQAVRGRLLGPVCRMFGHRLGVVEVMEGTPLGSSEVVSGRPNTIELELEPGFRCVCVVESRQRTGCRVCGAVMGERADPNLGSAALRGPSLTLLDTTPLVEAAVDLGRQGPQPAVELAGDVAGPRRLDRPPPASALRRVRLRSLDGFGVNGYTFLFGVLFFVPLLVLAWAPLWVGVLANAVWWALLIGSIVVATRDVARDERYAKVWDYPAVETLVKCYLTSEWLSDYENAWSAVDDFLANEPSAIELPAELTRLIDSTPSELDLRAYVIGKLGSAYLPENDDLTMGDWLHAVGERARRAV